MQKNGATETVRRLEGGKIVPRSEDPDRIGRCPSFFQPSRLFPSFLPPPPVPILSGIDREAPPFLVFYFFF